MIELISDTVTRPTKEMLEFMVSAPVGDDVFQNDPTVNALQERLAGMFGHEAALFCPSGTMTNQLAIKMHTDPLDELICDIDSHVFQYETGGYAFNSSVAVNLIQGKYGKINAEQIKEVIKPTYDWLPKSQLVVLENSCNKGGGSFYTLEEVASISQLCRNKGLKLHLDGARLFNVLVETGDSCADIGTYFDSISICLSKGLGAPVGSVLIGTAKDITLARRFRKVMGGGMRQSGILAAAGIFALDHNIDRLKKDNDRAKQLGKAISQIHYVNSVDPVMTNIVIFELEGQVDPDHFVDYLSAQEISCARFGGQKIRFVTHLGIDDKMIDQTIDVLYQFKA